MTLSAAVGVISQAVEVFRNSLADSATFRTFANHAPTREEALERIHYEGYPPPGDGVSHTLDELLAIRPCAIVWMDAEAGASGEKDAAGSGSGDFVHRGAMVVKLIQDIPAAIAADPGEISRRICNTAGGVIADLLAGNEVGEYLAIRRWTCVGPMLQEPTLVASLGNTIEIDLRLEWGPS